ncbi:ABC transporter permease [Streptomyces sp. NPDC008079]|uniref:ABC transporter permease n=1 Tax=Streptomyces sp. NPDC008079 TaxID=3364806 RepID=UPI0036E35040
MKRALHAEWTKARTVPGTGWLLLAVLTLTVLVSALAAGTADCTAAGCRQDVARTALTGIYVGQAVVAVLAVLTISGEYSSGMIRTTLTAVPRRHVVLTAKALVLTGLVLATGAVTVAGCLVTARLLVPISLTDGSVLRAAAGSVLYLALIALLSLGAATAVRDSAAAVAVVLGLLYALPLVAQLVTDQDWQRRLQRVEPMTAGLGVQATVDVGALPLPPWAGLGVLAAWAAAALLGGGLLLRGRDA